MRNELHEKVVKWGAEKGIVDFTDSQAEIQFETKVKEEFVEVEEMLREYLHLKARGAPLEELKPAVEDLEMELGDLQVTLIMMSVNLAIDLEMCLEMAYNKISKRKGKTVNGVFIKD